MYTSLSKTSVISAVALTGITCAAPAQASSVIVNMQEVTTNDWWCPKSYNENGNWGTCKEYAFVIKETDDNGNITNIYDGQQTNPQMAFGVQTIGSTNNSSCISTSMIPYYNACIAMGNEVLAYAGQWCKNTPGCNFEGGYGTIGGWTPAMCPTIQNNGGCLGGGGTTGGGGVGGGGITR